MDSKREWIRVRTIVMYWCNVSMALEQLGQKTTNKKNICPTCGQVTCLLLHSWSCTFCSFILHSTLVLLASFEFSPKKGQPRYLFHLNLYELNHFLRPYRLGLCGLCSLSLGKLLKLDITVLLYMYLQYFLGNP